MDEIPRKWFSTNTTLGSSSDEQIHIIKPKLLQRLLESLRDISDVVKDFCRHKKLIAWYSSLGDSFSHFVFGAIHFGKVLVFRVQVQCSCTASIRHTLSAIQVMITQLDGRFGEFNQPFIRSRSTRPFEPSCTRAKAKLLSINSRFRGL